MNILHDEQLTIGATEPMIDLTAKRIVLFDGLCTLCSRSVQFILARDPSARFLFAHLQSKTSAEILKRSGAPIDADTFVLVDRGEIYTRSTAALRVVKHLRGGWKLMYVFIFVPRFLRDAVYSWVAKNRSVWFRQRTVCWLPTDELRSRFLQ